MKGQPRKTSNSDIFKLIALTLRTLNITPNQFLRIFNDHANAENIVIDGEMWEMFIHGIMTPADRKRNGINASST